MSAYESLDEQKKFACRVIADHARATAFAIADGVLPSNEGRNYVLRKIMRRAIYQGRHTLGFEGLFFHKVTNFVVDQMGEAYPELESHREFIDRMVRLEEERFGATLALGLPKVEERLTSMIEGLSTGEKKGQDAFENMRPSLDEYEKFRPVLVIYEKMRPFVDPLNQHPPAMEAFEGNIQPEIVLKLMRQLVPLYDTYGIPRDLLRVALEERGFIFTEEAFNDYFDMALRELQPTISATAKSSFESLAGVDAIAITAFEGAAKGKPVYASIANRVQSLFRGYETSRVDDAKVLSLIRGDADVAALNAGEEGEVVLDQTPFYAESGGQVSDVGKIIEPSLAVGLAPLIATVTDTFSPAQGLIVHKVKVEQGILKVGDTVTAEVDVEKRDATRRNHTATHLVHAALREVLGGHVKQAGSVVAPNYLRFDFTHYQPMTEDEIKEVERLVNEQVLRNVKVETELMPVEEAIRSGAMALFGEKYSGMMRVLTVPGFSKELCGGTHVRATGDVGIFKITSDESIASGVRRIRAITGIDAYQRFREDEEIIEEVTSSLRTSRAELPAVIGRLQDELKKARREAEELRLKIASGALGAVAANGIEAREVAGVRVLAKEASGLDAAGMRQLSDTLLARIKSGVVVLGRSNDGKASLIVRTSDDLTKRVPAGQVIKELAPIIGGRGGGKPDMAEGGGNQPEKLSEALQASYGVIERMLS